MALTEDTFYTEASTRLTATGWVFTDVSRYDPTSISGITPSGRAFSISLINSTITLTVAGRTRTITRAKAAWEAGDQTVDALLEAWQLLPVNQR